MLKISSIKPLSQFVRNAKEHIEDLRKTGAPEVLTVNGEAAVVVQSAESYEQMSALADQARQDARLQSALRFFRDGGEGRPLAAVFDELEPRPS